MDPRFDRKYTGINAQNISTRHHDNNPTEVIDHQIFKKNDGPINESKKATI